MSMGEVVVGIIVIVVLFWAMLQVFYILDFFKEVPKQLKRIADALEKRNGHG